MIRRGALAALAAVPLVPSIVRAQGLTTIKLGTVASEAVSPIYYAMRSGIFERNGIKLEITRTTSGAATSAAVAGGALDVGVSSLFSIVLGKARGIPFTIVAPIGLWLPSSEGGLVVQTTSTLRAPKDFNGKTISVAAVNDISDLAMRIWMDQTAPIPNR